MTDRCHVVAVGAYSFVPAKPPTFREFPDDVFGFRPFMYGLSYPKRFPAGARPNRTKYYKRHRTADDASQQPFRHQPREANYPTLHRGEQDDAEPSHYLEDTSYSKRWLPGKNHALLSVLGQP